MNLAAKLLIVQPKSLCRCLRACRRLNTVFLLREGFDCGYGRIVATVPAGYWSPLTLPAGTAATTSISIRKSGDALLTAHADHLMAPVKRVLHHVLPELPGDSHDADLHHVPLPPDTARRPF